VIGNLRRRRSSVKRRSKAVVRPADFSGASRIACFLPAGPGDWRNADFVSSRSRCRKVDGKPVSSAEVPFPCLGEPLAFPQPAGLELVGIEDSGSQGR
jgi:hypothetical protein